MNDLHVALRVGSSVVWSYRSYVVHLTSVRQRWHRSNAIQLHDQHHG